MDRINIKNLEVFGKHGVLPEEKTLVSKFVISAALYFDLRNACRTDAIEDTLDYGDICFRIKAFVENNTFNLIETLAGRLAEMLLTGTDKLQRVWLEVKKPWAPVAAPLETVSVGIERGWSPAYLALGSNMGEKKAMLDFAVSQLEASGSCRVRRVSSYIETEPYGYKEQDVFLNACAVIDTLLTPHELLGLLHETEEKAGRVRGERWGPRTLDMDIIFYGAEVISDESLRIPHADMHRRDFVLLPLCEIAPHLLHPVLKKTASELLEDLVAGVKQMK